MQVTMSPNNGLGSMGGRLHIKCGCCGNLFPSEELRSRHLRRNKYGIDVFSCPGCGEQIKIDPYEYVGAQNEITTGNAMRGVAIEAYKASQLMPCEQAARRQMSWFARLFVR